MFIDVRLLAPIATSIGIAVTVFLWYLNQRKKALSYILLEQHPVLNLKGAARNKLDIRFAGQNISDAYLIVLRVFNSGHMPINVNDYEVPLSLLLNPGASVLAVSIIETVPVDLEDRIKSNNQSLINKIEDDRITLTPVLLNEGDAITIQILARNTGGSISVRGHIQGIKMIAPEKGGRLFPKILTQFGALIMAFSMLCVDPRNVFSFELQYLIPWILLFLLGFVLLNAGIYWPKSRREIGLQITN